MKLTKEQKKVVESKTNTIVISNPGTGKTTTLSHKVLNLLDAGVNPDDILCITFTDKARKEMYDSIYSLGSKKYSSNVLMKIQIHTFHSFAFNYLSDVGMISGDVVDANFLRFSILNSFIKNHALNYEKEYVISEIVPKTENAIRYLKNFGITPSKINQRKAQSLLDQLRNPNSRFSLKELKFFLKYFIQVFVDYEEAKGKSIDYSDMLLKFLAKFKGKKFPYILVDEMQDMNQLEAKMAEVLGEKLFLVGDAKQAIFGFQGGSIANFLEFKKKCKTHFLTENFRSTQQILDYAKNHFLANIGDAKLHETELSTLRSASRGIKPSIISTQAPLLNILDIINRHPKKSIGIIVRYNHQITEISKFLDSNNIQYSSTSSQATTQNARFAVIDFLKGILSDDPKEKILASFTAFSPFKLSESFEFSKEFGRTKKMPAQLEQWKISLDRDSIDNVFKEILLPIGVSKGPEWFSTVVTVKSQIEQYFTVSMPSIEGLFDFLAVGEESYVERSSEQQIVITTVHKAKGLAFDVVAYLPKIITRTSFIDSIVTSILNSSKINVGSEIEEESLRIDFVAFTRAKKELFVITDAENSNKYHVDKHSLHVPDDKKDDLTIGKKDPKLEKAYALFLQDRWDDSKKLLKEKDDWLVRYIYEHFKNLAGFSFSSIATDPYVYLQRRIIRLPSLSLSTKFGSDVHSAIRSILDQKTAVHDYDGDVRKAVENALIAITSLNKTYKELEIFAQEQKMELPLESMVQTKETKLVFNGKSDIVFRHKNGFLIADFKTDKIVSESGEHNRQLRVYKKMFSILNNIPEDKIDTCIIYVALRGNINTNSFEWKTEFPGSRDTYGTFEKHMQKVLRWKSNPDEFITELISRKGNDELFITIKSILTNSASQRSRGFQKV